MSQIQEVAYLRCPLETIKLATNNFSNQNFLGQGGFGKVYKGQLPEPSNDLVAVKRLDVSYGQGQKEFLKEIVMLASYKHDNIVSLLGFCDENGEKVLVYKQEVNGSLENHLDNAYLKWEQRLQICLDAARGLMYLHDEEVSVIHRDIKSSNILLDENWKAKISDFGLSKEGSRNRQFSILVTDAVGTMGYVDPQYHETGVVTKASDVFAFGVVLCEVLCGKPGWHTMTSRYYSEEPARFISYFVKRHYKDGNFEEIIFAGLRGHIMPHSLETFLSLACSCMRDDRRDRPTMERVVKELEAILAHQIGDRTELWGSVSGGRMWSFKVNKNQKLSKIIIYHQNWVHSISFTKKDLDGTLHSSQYGSGHKGTKSEIHLDDDEEITGISGTVGKYYGLELISSLCFVTNKTMHGPFGEESSISFSKSWEVGLFAGFYGRCGWELDAIGCCFMTTV